MGVCVVVVHWHCSAQLSRFNMEKRHRNQIIIIIIIIWWVTGAVVSMCAEEVGCGGPDADRHRRQQAAETPAHPGRVVQRPAPGTVWHQAGPGLLLAERGLQEEEAKKVIG